MGKAGLGVIGLVLVLAWLGGGDYLAPGPSQLAGIAAGGGGDGTDCAVNTEALLSMQSAELVFRDGEHSLRLMVRLAETALQRGAGMQYLCLEAVRANPMLFVFEQPLRPVFHMENVLVELDIAFLDEGARVTEIVRMVPDGGLTTPRHNAAYALELLAGEAERLGLRPGMRMQKQIRKQMETER